MKKDLLTRPFRPDQIKQRKGHHGQMLSYVDVAAVIERLNEAFEHGWSFEIVQHEIQQGEVIVLGKLTAGGVIKTAFGGSGITTDKVGDVLSVADDLKAASSDALKKCASMLGVALELYGGSKERPPERESAPSVAARPRPLMPHERVTSRQLAALHSAARRTGLEKRDLEVFLEERVGHAVLNELSRADASKLISELSGNGNERHA
ncbi:MAG: Rad52/Rad22 family DNA repair protein [Polyangiaceae bacterium]